MWQPGKKFYHINRINTHLDTNDQTLIKFEFTQTLSVNI